MTETHQVTDDHVEAGAEHEEYASGETAKEDPQILELTDKLDDKGAGIDRIEASLGQIGGEVSGIREMLSSLAQQITQHILSDRHKDDAFERLYAELEEYKKNTAFENNRPLFMDLILLFDRVRNMSDEAGKTGDEGGVEMLGTISEELIEIMYRREIELIEARQEAFDPTIQRAIGIERTECEAEGNAVSRVVRKGFRYRERLLRPEEVIVKKYSRPAAEEDKEQINS